MFILPPLNVIAPSLIIDGDTVSCNFEDLKRIVFRMLEGVPFDEEWYLATYPDVQQAIEDGTVASAFDHYRRSGYLEGRMPLAPEVDESWYCNEYPDVELSIEQGDIADARDHFISTGWREGRQPCKMPVDATWYTITYPHATRRMEREGEASAESDFHRYGYYEGLLPFRVTSPTGRENSGRRRTRRR